MLLGAKEAPATMKKEAIKRCETRRFGGVGPIVAATAMVVVLGGCSSVPNAVNPVKWYENTVDYFASDKEQKAEADKTNPPGADQAFPTLGSVPAKPEVSSTAERQKVAQGLVGDREGRRYATDVQRQGAPDHVLGTESPTAAASAGAPTPVPSLPVVAATPSAAPVRPAAVAQPPAPLMPSAPPAPNMAVGSSSPAPKAPPTAAAADVAPRMSWPVGSASAPMPAGPDAFETVVVSSSGVDEVANMPAASAPKDRLVVARRETASDIADGRKGSIKVATIQFANGSADLDSRDRSILREVVALQHERGGVIRVVGHASSRTVNMDPVRHKLVNYDVSSARAETVAKTLAELGAGTTDVVVVSKSDTDPVYYEFMPSGEAGNRRTEVYLDF